MTDDADQALLQQIVDQIREVTATVDRVNTNLLVTIAVAQRLEARLAGLITKPAESAC